MANLLNRCMFRAASGGSGDFVVASAETGARTPTEAGAENGQTYSYVAESDDRSQVAFGTGTWNSGTSTLVRGTEEFIGSGFAGNFSAAPRVMLTPLAADFAGGGGAWEKIDEVIIDTSTEDIKIYYDPDKYIMVQIVLDGVEITKTFTPTVFVGNEPGYGVQTAAMASFGQKVGGTVSWTQNGGVFTYFGVVAIDDTTPSYQTGCGVGETFSSPTFANVYGWDESDNPISFTAGRFALYGMLR